MNKKTLLSLALLSGLLFTASESFAGLNLNTTVPEKKCLKCRKTAPASDEVGKDDPKPDSAVVKGDDPKLEAEEVKGAKGSVVSNNQ